MNYSNDAVKVLKYGSSQNKLFEYLTSGKPILANNKMNYSILSEYKCGIESFLNVEDYAQALISFADMQREEYLEYCSNARRAAKDYDFKVLTQRLIQIIDEMNNR